MKHFFALFALLLSLSLVAVEGYKPVLCMHGYSGSHHDFDSYAQWIEEAHPGTPFVSIPVYEDADSHREMWVMLDSLVDYIENFSNFSLADGYILIGHSQGALLTRCALERMYNHSAPVHRYISMAGPQLGVNGIGKLPYWFDDFLLRFADTYMYTEEAQTHYSAAGFWHDENRDKAYLKDNIFLPILNNEVPTSESSNYKAGFLRAKSAHFFASPDDGTIMPWLSGLWRYPDAHGKDVDMEGQRVYTEDLFGLKTMNESGRLFLHQVDGVKHTDWIDKKEIFTQHILPLLD